MSATFYCIFNTLLYHNLFLFVLFLQEAEKTEDAPAEVEAANPTEEES